MRNRQSRAISKSQSAIEYLMTYGWAILIIGIVLAALFQLGVFDASNFVQRAQPGSCQISRIGTGLSQTTSLDGQCTSMPPQFVAQFLTASSYFSIPGSSSITITPTESFTISYWMDTNSGGNTQIQVVKNNQYATCAGAASGRFVDTNGHQATIPEGTILSGKWYLYTWTMSSAGTFNTVSLYINGSIVGTANINRWSPLAGDTANILQIGGAGGQDICATITGTTGYLANVQMYNITLTSAKIQQLYLNGIGSPPVSPEYTVGWWPLNGNGNDYSGNNNNGNPVGQIIYSNSWISSYTPP